MAVRQDDTDTVLMQVLMREQERLLLQGNGLQEQLIFASLQTDKERHAYAQKKTPNLEKIFPKIIPRFKKCSMTAELLKTDGNKAFVQRQYGKAEELYTLSAAYAIPESDGEKKDPVALAIANRSGALFHAKKYKEALVDITNAFDNGYPDELQYKLYDRRGKCYMALKDYKEAESAFELATAFLDQATLDEEKNKSTLKQIKENVEFCVKNRGDSVEVDLSNMKGELPKLADGPNETHPSLSSACAVEYKPNKGRCVVATRDIKPGEVLLVEKPFASVFMPNEEYKDCCHHCFYPCDTLLPCLKCSRGRYCSVDCRDVSWETYHKYECGVPLHDLIWEGTSTHLAMRIMMIAGLDQVLEAHQKRKCQDNLPKNLRGCNEDRKFLSSDYATVQEIHAYEHKPTELYHAMAFSSVFVTKLMEKMGFFDNVAAEKKKATMDTVGEILMPHMIPHVLYLWHNDASWPASADTPDFDGKMKMGLALHPTNSLFNHSCEMETFESYYGNIMVVRALQSFEKGQEIHANYQQYSYLIYNKFVRQEFLLDASNFLCACEACEGNWPMLDELESLNQSPFFRCTACKFPFGLPKDGIYTCIRCKNTESLVSKGLSFNAATAQLMKSDDITNKLQYIQSLEKILAQPNWCYNMSKYEIMRYFFRQGSYVSKRYQEGV